MSRFFKIGFTDWFWSGCPTHSFYFAIPKSIGNSVLPSEVVHFNNLKSSCDVGCMPWLLLSIKFNSTRYHHFCFCQNDKQKLDHLYNSFTTTDWFGMWILRVERIKCARHFIRYFCIVYVNCIYYLYVFHSFDLAHLHCNPRNVVNLYRAPSNSLLQNIHNII